MCYSALIKQDLKRLGLKYSARVDLALFDEVLRERLAGKKRNIPKGFEEELQKFEGSFAIPIRESVERFRQLQLENFEKDLFLQKKRKDEATKKNATKFTKTSEKEISVSGRQIERILAKIEKIQSKKILTNDYRIYAFDYAPVLISVNGERKIVPMRYHLRPAGMNEDFDRKYPGCYNARRDSLTGFWKNQFGKNHALLIMESFFEHVKLHDFEQRDLQKNEKEKSIVIEFRPSEISEMLVPCIWDNWGEEFYSFALITDEPPSEVRARGHDRCPIFLKPELIDRWLNPQNQTSSELLNLLDQTVKPFYQAALAG
jgi:putative SOS response-associated peptidase YedK